MEVIFLQRLSTNLQIEHGILSRAAVFYYYLFVILPLLLFGNESEKDSNWRACVSGQNDYVDKVSNESVQKIECAFSVCYEVHTVWDIVCGRR